MHKRGLALMVALAVVIASSLPGIAANSGFVDVPKDHWAYDAVTRLVAAGLLEGYPDGSFGGDRTLTRYEMATILARVVSKLEDNMEEQVAAKAADLDQRVADAVREAREALAAALKAQSTADSAAEAALDASRDAEESMKQALVADRKAGEALRQAEAALDASKAMEEVARAARAVAEEALALAKRVESGSVRAEDVKALEDLADAAYKAASRSEAAAEAIRQRYVDEIEECQAAVEEAKAIASKAEELARNAVTAEELEAVQQAVLEAAEAADRAERLAMSAAQLEDVAQIAAKANDALALAAQADARAREALAGIEYEKRYRYDDSAKASMRDYVQQSILAETDNIKNEASALARRVLALEGKLGEAISAEEAEAIAERIVAERIKEIAGDAGSDTIVREVTKGDVDALRVLIDERVATLSSDLEALDREFAAELQALGKKVADLDRRLDETDQKVAQLAEASSEFDYSLDELKEELADIQTEVAALTGNVVITQSDLAGLVAKVEAVQDQLAALESDAAKQSDVDELAQRIKATEEELADIETEVAALTGNVVTTQSDLAGLVAKMEAVQDQLAALESDAAKQSDVDELAQQIKATEDDLTGIGAEVAALTGNVMVTQSDVARLAAKAEAIQDQLSALETDAVKQSDVDELAQRIKGIEDDLSGISAEVAALTGNVVITQSDLANLVAKTEAIQDQLSALESGVAKQSDVDDLSQWFKSVEDDLAALIANQAATRDEVARLADRLTAAEAQISRLVEKTEALEADKGVPQADNAELAAALAATQGELETVKAELAQLREAVGTTRAELAEVDENLKSVEDGLAPIRKWFEVTKKSFGVELVYHRVRGTSLYTDPRAAYKTEVTRAAEGQWYDSREFVRNENFVRYYVDITTEPADGATFEGRVYADRNIQLHKWDGAGIEAELTTAGIVESLRIGDLDPTHGTGKFSKYILDTQKWDAQLYRINGLQGTASLGPISIQGLAGHGWVKRVDPATGDDLPGSDIGSLFGVAGQLQLTDTAEGRFSWLNLRHTLQSNVPTPVTAYALGIEGTLGTLRYDAEVAAAKGGRRPQVGDITVSQALGATYWTAEYGYRRPNWRQRLASPAVDGSTMPNERFLGVEFVGLEALGFDTRLVHRTVENVDGYQYVLMARGVRDMEIILPFTATVELGFNRSDLLDKWISHTMVDLSVTDYALGAPNFIVDASVRHEQTPLQIEDWDLRWRNASLANAGSSLEVKHQNWIADTTRTQVRAKATLYLTPQSGVYAGGRYVHDSKKTDASLPSKTAVLGAFTEMEILDTDVRLQGEWLRASGAKRAKRSVTLTAARGIGEGQVELYVDVTDGRGLDTEWVNTVDSHLEFSYPLYEMTDLQVKGQYVRCREADSQAYRDARLTAGFAMTF
jgi:DNA repair exonuclease SbcCD ATPase subunit